MKLKRGETMDDRIVEQTFHFEKISRQHKICLISMHNNAFVFR